MCDLKHILTGQVKYVAGSNKEEYTLEKNILSQYAEQAFYHMTILITSSTSVYARHIVITPSK